MTISPTAFQAQYRQEFVKGFEVHSSLLRESVTNEAVFKGNQAIFLVADSGGASAVTRGVNGLIPARPNDKQQKTCTLAEWHDLVEETGFNVFASQGNSRQIMQMTSMAVINRKVDTDIISSLSTGTVNTGAAVQGSVKLVMRAQTILANAAVPLDSNMTLLVTPAFLAYLMQSREFQNAEYVKRMPLTDGEPLWHDQPVMYRWMNFIVISHPLLPNVGTNNETCFLYHKNALGHAVNTADLQTFVGYDDKQDLSWCRTTVFLGTNLLQNSGVVVINHDGSEMSS